MIFTSLDNYEQFIYTLQVRYPIVQRSTLVLGRLGHSIAAVTSTHPHHKHIHPDIKHNRIPAPGLSFIEPNLPFLIEEIMRSLVTDN